MNRSWHKGCSFDFTNAVNNRQKILFIAGIIILALIALAEGIALLRHTARSAGQLAAAAQSPDLFPESEDVILQETAEDLEHLHHQINRLFCEMSRGPFFENIRSGQPEQQRHLQSEIERIFQTARAARHRGALSLLEKDWQNVARVSAVNIQENETNYAVAVSLPGFEKDKINISVRGRILAVEAENEQRPSDSAAPAVTSGRFKTQIMLPAAAKGEAAEAFYENSVLKIIVPKSGSSNSLARQVTIR